MPEKSQRPARADSMSTMITRFLYKYALIFTVFGLPAEPAGQAVDIFVPQLCKLARMKRSRIFGRCREIFFGIKFIWYVSATSLQIDCFVLPNPIYCKGVRSSHAFSRIQHGMTSEFADVSKENIPPLLAKTYRNAGWWRNITEVKCAIEAFNESLDKLKTYRKRAPDGPVSGFRIPPEATLRAHPGGMKLIHAIRMYGGFKSLKSKFMAMSSPQRADKEKPNDDKLWVHLHAASNVSRIHRSISESARTKSPYGRFLRNGSTFLRQELVAFNRQHTNNKVLNVIPSLAQLRCANRMDLINAIDRCGGRCCPSNFTRRAYLICSAARSSRRGWACWTARNTLTLSNSSPC